MMAEAISSGEALIMAGLLLTASFTGVFLPEPLQPQNTKIKMTARVKEKPDHEFFKATTPHGNIIV